MFTSDASSFTDVALKLMPFEATGNVRAVMHSSLTSVDIQRAIGKIQSVLHQLRTRD